MKRDAVNLFWDASALSKRFAIEPGSQVVDSLLDASQASTHFTTLASCAETFSVLVRKLNSGTLSNRSFSISVSGLYDQVLDNADFTLLSIDDHSIRGSLKLIRKHNLNATDAAILEVAIRVFRDDTSGRWILVASDKRLLRAAQAEDLAVLDPEAATATTLTELLSR